MLVRSGAMSASFNLYMDDSGTRHPDRQLENNGKPNWFALGGVMVRREDEDECRGQHERFCEKWEIEKPLHSEEIRHRKRNFRWLDKDEGVRQTFLSELEGLLTSMPVLGVACVIDRNGYHNRYHARYGKQKWSLCKSSFAICVERAGKFAREQGGKLNVYVERSDRKTDNQIKQCFCEMKQKGHPFDQSNASRYDPLTPDLLGATLYDFKLKDKTSPMMQIADLYLYPICQGGYNAGYYPFRQLMSAAKLIDCRVDDTNSQGIKYYCFEKPAAKD
jgi:hypothetical protein